MRIVIVAATAIAFAAPAQAREPQSPAPASLRAKEAETLEVSARRKRARSYRARRHKRMPGFFVATSKAPPPASQQIDPRLPLAAAPIHERRMQQVGVVPARAPTFEPRTVPPRRGLVAPGLHAAITRHAAANGVPESLVHRVIIRESRYNARAVGRGGAMGLMQIKTATARSMGYNGSARGLLDAETNLTYAVRYLAGAYRAAGGNANRAVAYYASGYHGRGVGRRRR